MAFRCQVFHCVADFEALAEAIAQVMAAVTRLLRDRHTAVMRPQLSSESLTTRVNLKGLEVELANPQALLLNPNSYP